MAIEFRVARIETVYRRCEKCGGVGHTLRRTMNGTFKNPCPHCIEGRYMFEKRTETTLTEALKELGLIN